VSDLELRAGDDERQATIDRLASHFRVGRLSADELEERTAAAHAARTRGDLAALEADLPAPAAEADRAAQRRRLRERLVGALGTCALLWVIWIATGADGFVWPLIPTAAILIGVITDRWGDDDAPAPTLPPVPPLPTTRPRPPRRRDHEE
jgi:hypothetical protein